MPRQYRVVSADGHIDLNADVWTYRVAAKWRDRAPKRVKMPNGSDAIVVDGGKPNTIGITRSMGVAHKDLAVQVPTFEKSAGTGSWRLRKVKISPKKSSRVEALTWSKARWRTASRKKRAFPSVLDECRHREDKLMQRIAVEGSGLSQVGAAPK